MTTKAGNRFLDGYPRDMLGYGRQRPDPAWPEDAVLAVQFVVNYEEGGENNILHGDAASEAFLSEIVGADAWPGQRHMNMESIYEYGSRVGFWRLWRMFTERDMPVTVFGIATALARNPDVVEAMHEASWEIATHGLKWIDFRHHDEALEREQLQETIALHSEITGTAPAGIYTGRTSEHSLDLAAEYQGFRYCADSYADELPYWRATPAAPDGSQLIVPYTLDASEGLEGHKGMMSIGLHCRLAGRPGRAAALARFLDYVSEQSQVWVTRRIDIADHWHTHFPPSAVVA